MMNQTNFSLEKVFNDLAVVSLQNYKDVFAALEDEDLELDAVTPKHIKIVLGAMAHPIDIIREKSAQLLLSCISVSDSVEESIEYILEMLIDRTNCSDLEDIQNTPEPMRPAPSQKPSMMIKLREESEEVRLLFCSIIKDLLDTLDDEYIIEYMNEYVNILRTLTMDPNTEIRKLTCKIWTSFLSQYKEVLINFSTIICRALLLPLTSKKSQIQISALKAIRELMFIGPFKQSVRE